MTSDLHALRHSAAHMMGRRVGAGLLIVIALSGLAWAASERYSAEMIYQSGTRVGSEHEAVLAIQKHWSGIYRKLRRLVIAQEQKEPITCFKKHEAAPSPSTGKIDFHPESAKARLYQDPFVFVPGKLIFEVCVPAMSEANTSQRGIFYQDTRLLINDEGNVYQSGRLR